MSTDESAVIGGVVGEQWGGVHVRYEIEVQLPASGRSVVTRNFREFDALHRNLQGRLALQPLPDRDAHGMLDDSSRSRRREGLQSFMASVLEKCPRLDQPGLADFLGATAEDKVALQHPDCEQVCQDDPRSSANFLPDQRVQVWSKGQQKWFGDGIVTSVDNDGKIRVEYGFKGGTSIAKEIPACDIPIAVRSAPRNNCSEGNAFRIGYFDGVWRSAHENVYFHEIAGTLCMGSDGHKEIFRILEHGLSCSVELHGDVHRGTLSSDGKRIAWDDGDVWERTESPMPTKSLAAPWLGAAAEQQAAALGLPPQRWRLCVLGSTAFHDRSDKDLVKRVARSLAQKLPPERVAVLTCGMPGVQEEFVRAFGQGEGHAHFHLLPHGHESGFGTGQDIRCGSTLHERRATYAEIGHLYVTFEGGPGVAQEAAAAFRRGAAVLPVISTGGASAGLFQFPAGALKKPGWAAEGHWAMLKKSDASPADVADAISLMALSALGISEPLA